jgi:RHS repeat-associated protein
VGTGQTKTLQAYAYKSGMTNSNIHSANYTFERDCGQGPQEEPMTPDTIRTAAYNLDKAGNRTSVVDSISGTTTYSLNPNNLNEYSLVGNYAVTNGNEHHITAYQSVAYTYINDERLTRAASGGNIYDLKYDALGRCVKRTLNGVTTYYFYDVEKPILEYDANGTLVGYNRYGKGIDEILQRIALGTAYFFQQDHQGSVTHLTSTTGAILEYYRYDVFGAPSIYAPNGSGRSSSIYDNRFLFAGREYAATYRSTYIPTFKFYEYRARAYHPGLGRFMSEDPKLFDPGDYNLFRYCHNDPVDFTDPMGLEINWSGAGPQNPGNQAAVAKYAEIIAATRELVGLSSTYIRAALSAQEGVTMAQISGQENQTMHTYSLKSQYKIGDLSGSRGYQYVWDPDPNCSGQCMTTVQHMSGAPSSRTPLLRGNPVGPNTKQGTAIATGFELRNGQWVYPSRPAKESNNHAAFYVAALGRGLMQTLEAQRGMSIHLWHQSMNGWYEITSRLPPRTTSTSELHASGGLYGPFY